MAERKWSRRAALTLAILLSGGMLVLPRVHLLALLIAFSFVASGWRSIPLRPTLIIWAIFTAIFAAALLRPGALDVGSLGIRYANFIAGLILLSVYLRRGLEKLSEDLFTVLPWMAAQALLTFILANAWPSLFQTVSLPDGGSFQSIWFVFNYHVVLDDSSGWHRPNGFFWEPGVFQLYLNIYLYLGLFVFRSKKHVISALAASLAVYSTTGMLITGMLLASATWRHVTTGASTRRRLAGLAALVILPTFSFIAVENLQDKLLGQAQGSSMIRHFDLLAGWNVISQHPILGIGFDHNVYKLSTRHLTTAQESAGIYYDVERSTSNGVMYAGYTLGIPLALVFVWGMFRQKLFLHPWVVGSMIFLAMLGEALVFTPFILAVIFSAFVKIPSSTDRRTSALVES